MAVRNPAPAIAGRVWSCGFCAPGASGLCHDLHGRCREVWGNPAQPFVPATVDVDGEVMCGCALAGHPKVAAVTIVPVDVVELPGITEEVMA